MSDVFTLVVDGREPSAIFETFDRASIAHERRNLDVGDFEIASGDRVAAIVERKTWSDLASSVSGNRLAEQTARILEKCKAVGARPVLLVEHDSVLGWEGSSGGLSNKFLDCCLTKYALEGFSVVRTRDAEHTRDVVVWILRRCREGKVPSFVPAFSFDAAAAGTRQFRKKDFGGKNAWRDMLTAVRGVSKAKADRIVARFASAPALIEALANEKKGLQIEGIGKKLCSDIKVALMGKGNGA
jgi:ERCC4-type nuclease